MKFTPEELKERVDNTILKIQEKKKADLDFTEQMASIDKLMKNRDINKTIENPNEDPFVYEKVAPQPKKSKKVDKNEKRVNTLKTAAIITVGALVLGGYINFEAKRQARWNDYFSYLYEKNKAQQAYVEEIPNYDLETAIKEDDSRLQEGEEVRIAYIEWLSENPTVGDTSDAFSYFMENIYNENSTRGSK